MAELVPAYLSRLETDATAERVEHLPGVRNHALLPSRQQALGGKEQPVQPRSVLAKIVRQNFRELRPERHGACRSRRFQPPPGVRADANNSPAEIDILDFDPERLAHSAT